MQATTRHAISFADVNDPQRINDITAAMAASIDNAIDAAYRAQYVSANALLVAPTAGLVAGKSRAWTSLERLEWVWTGAAWIVVGGAVPAVSLTGAAVVAENNPTVKPIPWTSDYIGPSPSVMWSSGSPNNVIAPISGLYLVNVMTRWPDGANVEIGLQRAGVGIAAGPRQYGTRNAMLSALVSLTQGQDLRVTCVSYSGSQALAATSSKFTVQFVRSL